MLFLLFAFLPFFIKSKECTYTSNLIYINDDSSLEDIKDPFRPIFLRITSPGCPYSKLSQAQWEKAAELYPQVNFVTVDAWSNSKISVLFGDSIFTPDHALVAANSTTLIPDTQFGNSDEVQTSPQKFLDMIQQYTNLYPVSPPLMSLTPIMIDSFYSSIDDPIILLYNSRCSDEVSFINEWARVSNEVIFPNGNNPRIGVLDCSIYPDECKRWSHPYQPQTPRALIYSSKTGNYEALDSYSSITNDKIDGLYSNANSRPTHQIPTPLPVPDPEQGIPSTNGFTVLQNLDLQSRSLSTIKTEYQAAFTRPSSACNNPTDCQSRTHNSPSTCYFIIPSSDDHTKSLKLINFFRKLAGLPSDVTEDATWSFQCNHTAINIHKIGRVPSDHNIKPEYLVESLCGEPNNRQVAKDSLLSENVDTVFDSSYKLFQDEGTHNDGDVGHRRWLLHPLLNKVGLGFYPYKEENMVTHFLMKPSVTVIRVAEGSTPPASTGVPSGLSFVSWPPAGPFPLRQLPTNWHITHPDFTNAKLSDLRVVVNRDDGLHLGVKQIYLSKGNSFGDSVIIKMTNDAISRCLPMRTITVSVFNDALKKLYRFSFELFDDNEVTEVCLYASDKSKCPSSVEAGNQFGPGQYQASIFSNSPNQVKVHIVEPIVLGDNQQLTFAAKKRFFLSGNSIDGKVVIKDSVTLDVQDPTKTTFSIVWSIAKKSIGKLETAFKAKSIFIDIQDDNENSGLYDLTFYTGVQTNCGVSRSIYQGTNSDSFYTIGGTFGNFYVMTSSSPAYQEFNAASDSEHDKPNIVQIHTVFDMKNQNTNKRVIKVYVSNIDSAFPMNVSAFIPGRKRDYQFIMVGGDMYFECDMNISKYANSITFLRNSKYDSNIYEFDVSMPKHVVLNLDERNICPMDFVTINGARFEGDSTSKVLMPYVLGDATAISYNNIEKFYDFYPAEGSSDTGEINAYPSRKSSKKKCIITTPGGHTSYTVFLDIDLGDYKVLIFRPAPGKEDVPVTITLKEVYYGKYPLGPSETYRLFFENYKNLSLDMPSVKNGKSYLHLYRFENCGKVNFLDSASSSEGPTDITDNIILGDIDYGTSISTPSVSVQDSETYDASLIQTKNLSVSAKTTPTIKSITVEKKIQIDSATLILEDCILSENIALELKRSESWWPSMSLRNTPITVSSIDIDLGITSSARLLDDGEEYESHTIISGISTNSGHDCDTLQSKVVIINNGKFVLECSADKTELVAVKGKENAPILIPEVPGPEPSNEPQPPVENPTQEKPTGGGDDKPPVENPTQEKPTGGGDDKPPVEGPTQVKPTGGEEQKPSGYETDNTNDEGNKPGADSEKPPKKKGGFPTGAIIGIVVAVVVVIAVVVIVLVVIKHKKKHVKSSDVGEDEVKKGEDEV